jgi:NAD(P)-dependent dehydrogenase (short-subunit alcohol dehydrogenase family)
VSSQRKTAIVTGASQGIGAGIVNAFAQRDCNVVASSRKVTQSTKVASSDRVALVDGHIGEPATADRADRRHLLHQTVHGVHRPLR